MVIPAYIGLYALIINLVVAILANLVIRKLGVSNNADATVASDYAG